MIGLSRRMQRQSLDCAPQRVCQRNNSARRRHIGQALQQQTGAAKAGGVADGNRCCTLRLCTNLEVVGPHEEVGNASPHYTHDPLIKVGRAPLGSCVFHLGVCQSSQALDLQLGGCLSAQVVGYSGCWGRLPKGQPETAEQPALKCLQARSRAGLVKSRQCPVSHPRASTLPALQGPLLCGVPKPEPVCSLVAPFLTKPHVTAAKPGNLSGPVTKQTQEPT